MSDTEDDVKAVTPNTNQLIIDESVIAEEIDEFIEENQITDQSTESDVKDIITKLEAMRSNYRRKHKEMKLYLASYTETYEKSYFYRLDIMKQFIKDCNQLKIKIKNQVKAENDDQMHKEMAMKSKRLVFQTNEITRLIEDLETKLLLKVDDKSDNELKSIRKSIPLVSTELNQVGNKIDEILKILSQDGDLSRDGDGEISKLNKRYEKLIILKSMFVKKVNQEAELREIDKMEAFESSSLSIKLQKFKDYSSKIDIYTFQSLFEKLHLRNTPKKFLPDLLKNNYLEHPALSLVKHVNDIDEIWQRLKVAYGDSKTMLKKKLEEFSHIDGIWKSKDPSKVAEGIGKIINCMKDLLTLVKTHQIESKLYHGDCLERIYKIIGDARLTRWLNLQCENNWDGEQLWKKLMEFLEKEQKIFLQKSTLQCCEKSTGGSSKDSQKKTYFTNDNKPYEMKNCAFCGEKDHVQTSGPAGSKVIQYFACQKFVEMNAAERFAELRNKGLCFQCLFPGAKKHTGKHREGKCQSEFVCSDPYHDKFPRKLHVLVCDLHKDKPENKDLLQQFKERCINRHINQLPPFSREIQLSYVSTANYKIDSSNQPIKEESGIYMLQTIKVDSEEYTIFYDSGCAEFVSRHYAILKLKSRATKEYDGPIMIGGVGGVSTESRYGIYSVKLPLSNKSTAVLSGVCLEQITQEFHKYPLAGKVESDIISAYQKSKGNVQALPRLPKTVGGHVDFMFGIKYLRYFPEPVFSLPSGLTIYRSQFTNSDGSRGVIGGPHEVFTNIEKYNNLPGNANFVSNQLKLYEKGFQVNPDISLLGYNNCLHKFDIDFEDSDDFGETVLVSRKIRLFEKVEEAGTEVKYRCVQCRDCQTCKNRAHDENLSIKEEVEQHLIEKSITVNLDNKQTIAKLPILHEPTIKLAPNKNKAIKIFQQQINKLNKTESDKNDVVNSEKKLQDLGHVEYLQNLPQEIQQKLIDNPIQNFIPWRSVWKENSLSTPCRMVFDASHPTSTGFSLNDILAKGRNNMNKLVEIFIRWRSHKYGFHTDVQKMYNSIKLHPDDWCYQRYLWKNNLDDTMPLEEKIIKTLIYGVRSSGNQAECGLRRTANLSSNQYPEVCKIVNNDIYVDDCLSGENLKELALRRADELEVVMNRGGFRLKGICMSGLPPPTNLSVDGISISVAGLLWQPENDTISLDVKALNFARKNRGRKTDQISSVPVNLTRRHCASKVAEVFDLTGMFTPIIAVMKMDLHELVLRKLDWDDRVPDELREIWLNHFDVMAELNDIRFNRAVIPSDAQSTDVSFLSCGDASKSIICIAIYARFLRKCGKYSCQLIFSKSKLVPDGLSQPRAELFASLVNCNSSELVKRAFHRKFKSILLFTDSQIVLYWLNNTNRTLKQWVRNRIVEIQRFTSTSSWKYVSSENMIADIGTRRGVKLNDIGPESTWVKGFPWMSDDESNFPAYSVDEIKLNQTQLSEASKECPFEFIQSTFVQRKVPDDVTKRYGYSDYLIDPNKFRFKKVIRVLAIVLKFIHNLKCSKSGKNPKSNALIITNDDIKSAEQYYFRKATKEVKHFYKENQYEKFTKEVGGILYYTGRILPSDEISIVGRYTEAMKDLSQDTFLVPIIDKYSPLAYAIINEVHWYNITVKHSGVETTWRYVLKEAYIIEGRGIVKFIKKSCERCRYLEKKKVEVAMSPVSKYNITIAPCFYYTQVDLCGPFNSFSPVNKRASVKIWLVVFCCCSTSATSIKVMDSYSSTSFIQSFVRFSCNYGYPKALISDEGSQLVKAFNTMQLSYTDIKNKLYQNAYVDYELVPVGGHNMTGKVERKIKEVKSSLEKVLNNSRLSILQWETVVSEIANNINNLPLALGNLSDELETIDLITPNRLILGRNNDRSPVGTLLVTDDHNKIIKSNEHIFNAWFENWLINHVPKLMLQPKWFKSNDNIRIGDVVIFLKNDSPLCNTYQYGMVHSVDVSKDGKVRKVEIKYRNANENTSRLTFRAVRDIVIIHHIDETSVFEQLNQMNMKN